MPDRYLVAGGPTGWAAANWSTTSGGAPGASAPVAGDNVFCDANSGATTLSVNVASACDNLDLTGFTGTFSGTFGLAVSGSIARDAGTATFTYSGTITMNATSGVKTITSNGQSFPGAFTFNGAGGTWQLADNMSIAGVLTRTAGTVDLNGKTLTVSANAGAVVPGTATRVLAFGTGGTMVFTGTGTFNVTAAPASNDSVTGTGTIRLTNSSATARTVDHNSNDLRSIALEITAGTGSLTLLGSDGYWKSLDTTGFTGTFANGHRLRFVGSVTVGAGATSTGGTSAWSFFDAAGSATLTLNGVVLNRGIGINLTSGSMTLGGNIDLGSGGITLTSGTFSTGNYTVTALTLVSSNSNVRTLDLGTSTVNLSGTGTLFNISTDTNLTLDAEESTIRLTGVTSVTRSVANGGNQMGNLIVSAGSGTLSTSNLGGYYDMDFTGFTGDWTIGNNVILGNVTLDPGMTIPNSNAALTFSSSGEQTLRTNGVAVGRQVVCNKPAGTLTLLDDLTTSTTIGEFGRVVLVSGTFDANDFDVTTLLLQFGGVATRSLKMGSGTWTLVGTGTSMSATAGVAGMTVEGTATVVFAPTGGGAVDVSPNFGGTIFSGIDFRVQGFTGNFTVFGSPTIKGLDFTGFSGTLVPANINLYGDLTLSPTMTSPAGTPAIVFAGGSSVLTSNGAMLGVAVQVNGGNLSLADDLVIDSDNDNSVNVVSGTFDNTAGHDVTFNGGFRSTSGSARAVYLGSGTYTATGTGVVWAIKGADDNNDLDTGTATIKISNADADAKQFSGGDQVYNDLWFSGAGTLEFSDDLGNTFAEFRVDNPCTVAFDGNSVTTVSSFAATGAEGTPIVLASLVPGTPFSLVRTGNRIVSCDYLDITDSAASPDDTWYAGANSVDSGGNSGWIFTVPTREFDITASCTLALSRALTFYRRIAVAASAWFETIPALQPLDALFTAARRGAQFVAAARSALFAAARRGAKFVAGPR